MAVLMVMSYVGNDCGLPSLYMLPAFKHLYIGQYIFTESCIHSLLLYQFSSTTDELCDLEEKFNLSELHFPQL